MVFLLWLYTIFYNSLINTGTIRYTLYSFSLCASPDPYYIDIPPPSKESYYILYHPIKKNISSIQLEVAKYLTQLFTSHPQSHQSDHTQPPTSPYRPSSSFMTGDNDTSSNLESPRECFNMFSHTTGTDAAVLEYNLPNAQVLNSQMETNWGRS